MFFRKHYKALCLIIISLVLVACGGKTKRPSTSDGPIRKSAPAQQRGGGFLKGDGPGDFIPSNLDQIPDAIPRVEPLHRFANRPYVVLGRAYTPNTHLVPFRQRGMASWYGKKFHGRKTSTGEIYDMFAMTAAHTTLALPSYARVTNLGNGRSVVVRVNDRGPFIAGRIIDLSYAAAHRLGFIEQGTALVEVRAILPKGMKSPASTSAQSAPVARSAPAGAGTPLKTTASRLQKGVFLQLGAFSSFDNAENLRERLSGELSWLSESIEIYSTGGMHRVHLGPYSSRSEAEKIAETIGSLLGYRPVIIQR